MVTHDERVAHILRRTGFGVRPGELDARRAIDIHDLIDERIDTDGWSVSAEEAAGREIDDQWDLLPKEWMNTMLGSESPLHERMVWFWHDHFTSNIGETQRTLMWQQHQLIRRHALGNVRDLARAMLEDGAMLHFLDGSGSTGESPNENLSREYLELFMLGRNAGYTEDDVRAGARILAGWLVDWETGEVGFDPGAAYRRPVTFLGQRKRWDLDDYVDAVLAMPTCAEHIAACIHAHLVSTELTAERRAQLGAVLRDNDWELRPLLREMLHHDDMTEARGVRTRQPVEWTMAAAMTFGFGDIADFDLELWQVQNMGQAPFDPPNVAGWPDDNRWSSATQVMAKANMILNWDIPDWLFDQLDPSPAAVMRHCGVLNPTAETTAALETAFARTGEYDRGVDLLLLLTLLSPDFSIC